MTIKLPAHIAIIMDGNGRWAKKRFLPRIAGHKAGVEATRKVVRHCVKKGVKVLTVFAFSSENWRRPPEEVSYLMELFFSSLEKEVNMLHENNVQLRFIGNRHNFNSALSRKIAEVEALTGANDGMVLLIAVDYGGQWDITQATQKICQKIEAGAMKSKDVTTEVIASHLSFADLPDPDLFIRTSGEIRISNFMLWQLAYAELYFVDKLWPDFDETDLDNAMADFAERERRFGQRSDQLA